MPNLKDRVFHFWTGIHREVFKATNGRLFGRVFGMPVVMLTTTGRKSGKPRTTMLSSPVWDDEKVVLVASYGGDPRHPAWFQNLEANPDVEILMDGRRRKMKARVATEQEREELWPKVVEKYRGYGSYQRRTDRTIPLVILTAREEPA